jgi:hypothetical protein
MHGARTRQTSSTESDGSPRCWGRWARPDRPAIVLGGHRRWSCFRRHVEAESIGDLRRLGRKNWSTLLSSAKLSSAKFKVLFDSRSRVTGRPWVGAKVGANVHSHQATPGDVQPPLPQVNGTPGDMGLRRAIEWS